MQWIQLNVKRCLCVQKTMPKGEYVAYAYKEGWLLCFLNSTDFCENCSCFLLNVERFDGCIKDLKPEDEDEQGTLFLNPRLSISARFLSRCQRNNRLEDACLFFFFLQNITKVFCAKIHAEAAPLSHRFSAPFCLRGRLQEKAASDQLKEESLLSCEPDKMEVRWPAWAAWAEFNFYNHVADVARWKNTCVHSVPGVSNWKVLRFLGGKRSLSCQRAPAS